MRKENAMQRKKKKKMTLIRCKTCKGKGYIDTGNLNNAIMRIPLKDTSISSNIRWFYGGATNEYDNR